MIENDAKCAAQCEVTYGSLKGTDVGAVCILGTGSGGGMTIGDRVFTGGHGFASEFSYLSTKWTDKRGFGSKWGMDGSVLRLVKGIKMAVEASDPFDGIKAF